MSVIGQQIQPQHISKPEDRSLHKFHLLLTFIPTIQMILFWTLVLKARLFVGHWPSYARPDPSEMGADIHYFLCIFGMVATMASFPVMLVILFAGKRFGFKKQFCLRMTFYFVTFAIWFTALKMNLGGFTTWIAD